MRAALGAGTVGCTGGGVRAAHLVKGDPTMIVRNGHLRKRLVGRHLLPAVLVTAIALILASAAPAQGPRKTKPPVDEAQLLIEDLLESLVAGVLDEGHRLRASQCSLAEAEIFFEENATDGDLGIQFFLDGDAWKRVLIFGPTEEDDDDSSEDSSSDDGSSEDSSSEDSSSEDSDSDDDSDESTQRLLDIRVHGTARVIGLTEIFSESAEPSFDELPRDEFLALFPAGEYLMLAKSIDGGWQMGLAELTKDLPDQPDITAPEEDDEVDPDAPLVIEWEPVPDPDPPSSVIESYHVVVEKDEDDERLRVWTVDMLATDTTVTLPVGFLEPGKDYKVEILAIETSNNKTITEVEFSTAD
jgi:hypothetical protein